MAELEPLDQVILRNAVTLLYEALDSVEKARAHVLSHPNNPSIIDDLKAQLAEQTQLAQQRLKQLDRMGLRVSEFPTKSEFEQLKVALKKIEDQREHIKGLEGKRGRLLDRMSKSHRNGKTYKQMLERCMKAVVLEGALPLESVPAAVEDAMAKTLELRDRYVVLKDKFDRLKEITQGDSK